MSTLLVLFAIWIIIGLLIGALAGSIWKEARPYGEVTDYAISVVVTVLTGLADWYVIPLLGMEGAIVFIAAVIEPPLVALFVLWLLRYLKRR